MECSICLENNADVELSCSHFFHSECLNRWKSIRNCCPNCRSDIKLPDIRKVNLNLSDEEYSLFTLQNSQFQTFNVRKGTNPKLRNEEISFIFNFTKCKLFDVIDLKNLDNNIVAYVPGSSGNNIHLGKPVVKNSYITFDNSYVINRRTGHVYKTHPEIRKYKINNNDLFYKFS